MPSTPLHSSPGPASSPHPHKLPLITSWEVPADLRRPVLSTVEVNFGPSGTASTAETSGVSAIPALVAPDLMESEDFQGLLGIF